MVQMLYGSRLTAQSALSLPKGLPLPLDFNVFYYFYALYDFYDLNGLNDLNSF